MRFWRGGFRSETRKSDLNDEIEAHLTLASGDKQERGADSGTARREAEREFGNVALVKDVTRGVWGWAWLEWLQQDVKYAQRQLRNAPGFAVTVIATLALGIAAATAMFTVVDHVLLRPLPYPNPEQLVSIQEASVKDQPDVAGGAAYLDLRQWQERSRTFQQIAYYRSAGQGNFLEGNTGSAPVNLVEVSPNFFSTLGVRPELGGGFDESAAPFAGGVNSNSIVLCNSTWLQMYGGDPSILGKGVRLNGQLYTVAGVMPPGLPPSLEVENKRDCAWSAIQLDQEDLDRSGRTRAYTIIGRLKSGVSRAAAQADLQTLQAQIAKDYRDPTVRESRASAFVQGYAESLVRTDLKKALVTLLAAAFVLWLIACVNATNLFLVRGAARQREIAMRGALGASRRRVMQQLIVEALVLSGIASLLGSLLALIVIQVFERQIPARLPIHGAAALNLGILAALIGLTLLSTVLSSAWPAFLATRAPIDLALKQGGQQGGVSRGQNRIRGALVVAQIAMSLTLLVACGLLLRTIYALRHAPLGFRTDHILVVNLAIPSFRFAHQNMTTDLYRPLLERAQRLPGVETAALMTEAPLGQTFNVTLTLVGKDYGWKSDANHPMIAHLRGVSPEAQQVFGFSMLKGRFFNEKDTAGSQPVIVVNRAFARLYGPNSQDPSSVLGMHLWHLQKDKPAEVIGVLDDARYSSITQAKPEVEICIPQITPESNSYRPLEGMAMDLVLRTDRPLASIVPELRLILSRASPEFANATFTTMDQVVADSYGSQTLAAHLLEIFGGSALLLCAAGLYGLLAYIVAQRTREIGIRIALGAQRGRVLWLVLRQALMLELVGIAAGIALALMFGRVVRSFLYGVSAHDIWTLCIAALLLLITGALAGYLPAQKAARIDPLESIRAE